MATAKRQVPNAGERRLISILLGAASDKDRANESQKLLNWGYTAFDTVKLFDGGQAVATPKAWKGAQNTVKLGSPTPIVINVPAGTGGKVETQVVSQEPLVAPFTKGQSVGALKVMLGDQAIAEVPLVALEAVAPAGILGRAWDAIRLWIK